MRIEEALIFMDGDHGVFHALMIEQAERLIWPAGVVDNINILDKLFGPLSNNYGRDVQEAISRRIPLFKVSIGTRSAAVIRKTEGSCQFIEISAFPGKFSRSSVFHFDSILHGKVKLLIK